MKRQYRFSLLVLTVLVSLVFVSETRATDYLLYGKVLYGSSLSSEAAINGNITVYRLQNGVYTLHGNMWTDVCGNYSYSPGQGGSYKLVFWQTNRNVVDFYNNCSIILPNESLTQVIVYPSTLTIFNPVAQANMVTISR